MCWRYVKFFRFYNVKLFLTENSVQVTKPDHFRRVSSSLSWTFLELAFLLSPTHPLPKIIISIIIIIITITCPPTAKLDQLAAPP